MAESGYFSLDSINMPWSLEAEQAVLGSILVDPACLPQVTDILKPECFFQPQHREIFTQMLAIDNLGGTIDPLIVLDKLVEQGVFDSAGGKKYLYDIAQTVPSTENVERYAKIVREKYYLRSLITFSAETIEGAVAQENTADALLDAAEQKIYNIRQGKTTDAPSQLKDILMNQVFDTLTKLTGEDRELYKGYTTGFSKLDDILTGLNRSDLIIIGARPGMGKTSFALNLARNVAVIAKKKTLVFSLEMTKEQLAMRVIGTEARVSSKKMRAGTIDNDEWLRIGQATNVLGDCPLYFDDSSIITVPEMKAKARKLHGVECIIIDYLGLIQSGLKTENTVARISEITRNLKMMAKDLNVPVICCAQLNRDTEARGKSHRPQLSDLRDSGSIEQDADIVMMLYREEYYNGEKEDAQDGGSSSNGEIKTVSVIVVKNRHGELGTVDFAWDGDHTLFLPIDKVHNEN